MAAVVNRNICFLARLFARPLTKHHSSPSYSSQADNHMKSVLQEQLDGIRKAGTWKKERIIVSKQMDKIKVSGQPKEVINFCANNYLGLASDPQVVTAAKAALDSHGNGLSSVRFICGTNDMHKELEKKIAAFHGKEDAILYASCFDANAGIFEALLTPDDAVLSDELNHASIIDGIRLCKAKKLRYKHLDMADLEEKLKECGDSRMKLIVTDGVFSMDGDVAPLRDIVRLADKYRAITFIDECHATGFFGKTGRGTLEYLGLPPSSITIVNSTLGKALGGAAGGYTAASAEVVDLLRQRSRPYLFSNALPPPVVGSANKVFDLLTQSSALPEKVHRNTQRFRNKMKAAGFNVTGHQDHPICPVMLGDARLASIFADKMLEKGIYVIGFSYPVVPVGKARIRVQISASHTDDEVDAAVAAFTDVGKSLKVI